MIGDLFQKLDYLTVADLEVLDGVKRLMEAIVTIPELIEDYRIGKTLDEFLDFSRKTRRLWTSISGGLESSRRLSSLLELP